MEIQKIVVILHSSGRNVPRHNQKNIVMTTAQKIEIIEAVIYELSEFKDKYGNVPEDFSIHESRLQNLLEVIEREQPAPLNPHTCELCVGDVVDVYWSKAESTEGIILEIDDNLNEKLRYRVFDFWYDEPSNCSRTQLTLKSPQRAGVQIGEE